jgi:dTDP-4-dehydrorhamnose reductase
MKKKILIIGSKGMAGHVIYHYFKSLPNFDVIDISRDNDFFESNYIVDVTDTNKLKAIFEEEKPNVVVNCIGVLNKDAEDNPDKAIFLNSYFPHFLAKEGTNKNFKLIHISTDCVFNGKKGSYTEGDVKDGFGFYAQSKALGEVNYGTHLTIRTSIIGPELKTNGIGLFHWFMNQTGEINGYINAFWSGVTTLELSKAIEISIKQDINGLIHLTNGIKISKFDLIHLMKDVFDKSDIDILTYEGKTVDKSLINTIKSLDFEVKSYKEMLEDLSNYMKLNEKYYQNYLINV